MFPQWQGETQEFCPNAKVVLVGCKLDMRTDVNTLRELSKQRLIPVTHEQVRTTDIWEGSGKWAFQETTMDVGGRVTTKHNKDYAQYFPPQISNGVASLIKSHKKWVWEAQTACAESKLGENRFGRIRLRRFLTAASWRVIQGCWWR